MDEVQTTATEEDLTTKLQKEYDEKLAAAILRIEEEGKETIRQALEEWRKEQAPPTPDQIGTVLSQEYVKHTVTLPFNGGTKDFVISELPISKEKKFYALAKEKLVPKLKDFNLATLNDKVGIEEKAIALFDIVDPAMDLMAEVATMILNPKGETPDITTEWVQDNLSSFRIWNLIWAQMEVNKMRDFFSVLSRSSQSGRMMKPVSTQK